MKDFFALKIQLFSAPLVLRQYIERVLFSQKEKALKCTVSNIKNCNKHLRIHGYCGASLLPLVLSTLTIWKESESNFAVRCAFLPRQLGFGWNAWLLHYIKTRNTDSEAEKKLLKMINGLFKTSRNESLSQFYWKSLKAA